MKRLVLLAALLFSVQVQAAVTTGGNILQWPVGRDSTTNELWPKVRVTDASGNSTIAFSGTFTLSAAETAALTNTAASLAAPSSVSSPAFVALTSSATTKQLYSYNLSSATVKTLWVHGDFGGAAIRWLVTASGTAPADLATNGNYLATSATSQVSGPYPAAWFFHGIGVGASTVNGGAQVMQ